MTSDPGSNNPLQKELDYYKKRVDELAGENLKADYTLSGLRHELRQKKEGFALLSSLQATLGSKQESDALYKAAVTAINGTLGMDKSIVFFPSDQEGRFNAKIAMGANLDSEALQKVGVEFPPEVWKNHQVIFCNKATERSPFFSDIAERLELPYFIVSPIVYLSQTIAIFVSGRLREARPLYPPFDKGDADTFIAIGGLISSVIEAMKSAALRETDRLKNEFFANISHEFRTPITLTIGPLESILADRYGPISPDLHKEIQAMLRNQRRLLGLINQILDLAKLEAGAADFKLSKIPKLSKLLHERFEHFSSMATSRGIQLKESFAPEIDDLNIYLDVEKFDKVIFNLLSNALKFTKVGSITLSAGVKDGLVAVEVVDSGIGIRHDQLPHIFDRFRQADGSSSREFSGSGIGLSLVKEVIEGHGGSVQAFSEYGKGTTMRITLKPGLDQFSEEVRSKISDFTADSGGQLAQFVIQGEGIATHQELEEVEAFNATCFKNRDPRRPLILYVDDNRDLRNFVSRTLAREFDVFLGVNGKDGLDRMQINHPDLVLSDLMMPVMTGADLLSSMRSIPTLNTIPFVMLTAKSGEESKISELDRGADDYLNKPFSENELLARIRNLIKIRESHARIKSDLRAAREIQHALLPPMEAKVANLSIEVLYRPSEDLSGDFFDYFPIGNDLFFYIADVTSHGTPSAQVTYLVKGLFRSIIGSGEVHLPRIAQRMATEYCAYGLDYAVAIQVGWFNSANSTLSIVNSASPSMIHLKKGSASALNLSSNPLILPQVYTSDQTFIADEVLIKADESVFFATDGAYEFTDKKRMREFGFRQLQRTLELVNANWRTDLTQRLTEANGSETFDDDITIFKLTVCGV